MPRWLRMATIHTLRYQPHVWAGLRRGYLHSPAFLQVRRATQAIAAQQSTVETSQNPGNVCYGGSLGGTAAAQAPVAWYKVRNEKWERPLRDLDYYLELSQYPQAEEYPTLTKEFFDRPPSAALMSAVIMHLKSIGCVQDRLELLKRPERLVWRHNIDCRFGRNRMQIVGEGLSQDAAFAAVFTGFVYQLHVFDWLKEILGRQDVQEVVDNQRRTFVWTPSTIAAKMHIHNFAARFLSTPEITHVAHSDGLHRVTVRIPNTMFAASTIADEPRKAEFMTYATLKRVIEEQVAKEEHAIDLQDRRHVNLDTAEPLLQYYKLKQERGHFDHVTEMVPGPEEKMWTSLRLCFDGAPLSGSHHMPISSDARRLAFLESAIRLVKEQPQLLEEYQQVSETTAGNMPRRSNPAFASLSPDVVETLGECVSAADNTEIAQFELKRHPRGYKPQVGRRSSPSSPNSLREAYHNLTQSLAARSDELRQQQEWDMQDPLMAEARASRANLPIFKHKAQILALVKNHDQCIVVGSTGSGKSTQVPQLLLDDAIAEGRGALCNIICTQPRRVSSVALALAVCRERKRELGDIVGYRIGGDYYNTSAKGGSITYCTTELLANELERMTEELPHNVSHIIVDEVHERDSNLERLLSVIKLSFSQRLAAGLRIPKLVLMSATVESDLFERYFEMVSQDGTVIRPPYLNVPGRAYQTETKFLEQFKKELAPEIYQVVRGPDDQDNSELKDLAPVRPSVHHPKEVPVVRWESKGEVSRRGIASGDTIDAMAATIIHLLTTTKQGAILAFLPGASEMRLVKKALLKQKLLDVGDRNKYEVLMLHRSNPADLVQALDTTPRSTRRIMLSTNIAESSITFPEVDFVIDSGLQRSDMDLTTEGLQMLRDERISRASVLQRAGRAGRTSPGQYYGIFSTNDMQSMDAFPSAQDHAASRVQAIYLRAKIHFPMVPVQDVFDDFLTPVPKVKVDAAKKHLEYLGALTKDGEVSMLGYTLYRTSLEPSLARMVLLGMVFRCLDRAIILANLLSMKFSVFADVHLDESTSVDVQERARRFSGKSQSDLIAQMRAFEDFRYHNSLDVNQAKEWAAAEGIEHEHFSQLQARIEATRRTLFRAGFLRKRNSSRILNSHSENLTVLRMIICAGLYPNTASHINNADFLTHQAFIVRPSPTAVVLQGAYNDRKTHPAMYKALRGSIFCYRRLFASKSGSQKYFMGNVTRISPLMLALFSSNVKASEKKHNQLIIDDTLALDLSGDAAAASTFLQFKQVWDNALLSSMQQIAEKWSAEKSKREVFRSGITETILGAAQELLDYEEGQVLKREGDVDTFKLGSDPDDTTHHRRGVPIPRHMTARGFAADLSETVVICSTCGQRGHMYDDCVRTRSAVATSTPAHSLKDHKPEWDMPLASDSGETDSTAAWTPTFNAATIEDQGLSELPSDADNH